jgi:PiT family inorganic phosphate transporter
MEWLLLASGLGLAFANGANDNIKGVATVYGSGQLGYRQALSLATASQIAGSLASVVLATALVKAFSGKGLVPPELLTPELLTAVGLGAALTVGAATRVGLPISTTHAIVGGLVGAGAVAAGSALELGALGMAFVLPLAVGPVLAGLLAWAFSRGGDAIGSRVGPERGLRVGVEPRRALRVGHIASAATVGFARGLNDTPKILGLMVGASVIDPAVGAAVLGIAMALGGLLASRRVADTLALRITPMQNGQGLAANLATSLLVVCASRFGLPVSTTHVSTGGIFGIGAAAGTLKRRQAAEILGAWLATLPLAAALGALFAWSL